jgi:hypothetical protein
VPQAACCGGVGFVVLRTEVSAAFCRRMSIVFYSYTGTLATIKLHTQRLGALHLKRQVFVVCFTSCRREVRLSSLVLQPQIGLFDRTLMAYEYGVMVKG